ncbi:Chlorophyllase enzyme [Acinetobacter marinus]|uniref:Chlorophyllase enzyme n=1 Tax=Acinetobacter marinus TaxID=281375 RepID=A0A1G6JGB2_9GAMM|nr:hypothetical protein [Acinetobacter marinus]SDC17862.1 Chlorophyllase enzyme [Acinetobacter marinus]
MKKILITSCALLFGLTGCAALEQALTLTEEKITSVQTSSPLEKQYSAFGKYAVNSVKYPVNDNELKEFTVYYPQNAPSGEKFPLVVMVNGSGTPSSKYLPVFKHLASWGFIVIGSEELSSWSGKGASTSLDFALKLNQDKKSPIFQKININKIGVAGHSQGGAGAINLATNQPNSNRVRSLYTASSTRREGEANLFEFSPWKVRQPYFAVTGDGAFDQKIAPIASMIENQAKTSKSTLSVVAQRKGQDHGAMLYISNGYMTAWFLYTLNGDNQAKQVFAGRQPEIKQNTNWQDVRIKGN